MILAALTGCSFSAEQELINWLETQHIVEHVDNPPPIAGGSRSDVRVTIAEDATNVEFREFVAGAGDLLAKQEPSRQVHATIDQLTMLITSDAETVEGTARIADTVAALRVDERVTSGFVSGSGVDLVVDRVDLAAVYADYEREGRVVTLNTLEGDESVMLIGIVPCADSALAAVAALMTNPDVGAATLRACDEARVAARSRDGVLALALQLVPQVVGSGVHVTVVWDATPSNYFIAPAIEISLDSLTEASEPAIAAALADNLLIVQVLPEGLILGTEPGRLRQVLLGALANPNIADPTVSPFAALIVRAGVVTIQATDVAQAERFLELAEGYWALGTEHSSFTARPSEFEFIVYGNKVLDDSTAILDLMVDSGAWHGYSVTLRYASGNPFVLHNGEIQSPDAELGEALAEYWNSAR